MVEPTDLPEVAEKLRALGVKMAPANPLKPEELGGPFTPRWGATRSLWRRPAISFAKLTRAHWAYCVVVELAKAPSTNSRVRSQTEAKMGSWVAINKVVPL